MARVRNQSVMNNRQYHVNHQQAYLHGNAVPLPDHRPEHKERKAPRRLDPQVKKNRKRAQNINAEYAVFLLLASAVAVCVCVLYLQLQANIVSRAENISYLRKQLEEKTEQNDAAYNAVLDTVNLEVIRARAMGEMGMVYAVNGQVVEYQNPNKLSVIRYNEIPTTGVLPKSKDLSEEYK